MRSTTSRAHTILASFAPVIPPGRHIIDVGAGNGQLARQMAEQLRARVTMVDVAKYNQTDLALTICDSRALAFGENCFDYAVLSFVLHHSPSPDAILCEALRVARDVIVIENDVRGTVRGAVTQAFDSLPSLWHGVPPCHIVRDREAWLRSFRTLPVELRLLGQFSLERGFFRCFAVHLRRR